MKKYVVVLTAFLLFCGDMLAKNGEVIFWGVPFECRKADLAAAIKAKQLWWMKGTEAIT